MTTSTIQRTPETKQINSSLQIVKLTNQRFKVTGGYIMPKGFVLYHPTFGYFGFKGDNRPYSPIGGKKALQSILDDGGLLGFSNSIWFMEMV